MIIKIYIIAKSRIQSFCQLVFFQLAQVLYFFFLTLIGHKSVIWAAFEWTLHYAGYTPQDNRADFGPISPLPTILGNVLIILVVLKMILSDFPVVWGVLSVIWICLEERRRRPDRESQIFNMLYIYNQKSWCVGGNPEDTTHYRNKTVKSRIFFPSCLWSLTFWRSYKIYL